jgi:hypothetical protein
MRTQLVALLAVSVAVSSAGCKDQAQASANAAQDHTAMLAPLVDKDVQEVTKGLPEGAKRLSGLFAKGDDPRSNLPAVRKELMRIRRDVPDLLVAKSTFFALVDDKGVAIRNDLEQDVMAGQNITQIFPALADAMKGGYAATTGAFPGPPGPAGPDKDWVAGAAIKREDGSVAGMVITGWTYRAFARHLQESLERDIKQKLLDSKDTGKMPIVYVAVFDGSGVYTAPKTPQVNEKALADLHLLDATKAGTAKGTVTITDRAFGWAATRTPSLAPDTGVAVLRSEI